MLETTARLGDNTTAGTEFERIKVSLHGLGAFGCRTLIRLFQRIEDIFRHSVPVLLASVVGDAAILVQAKHYQPGKISVGYIEDPVYAAVDFVVSGKEYGFFFQVLLNRLPGP